MLLFLKMVKANRNLNVKYLNTYFMYPHDESVDIYLRLVDINKIRY